MILVFSIIIFAFRIDQIPPSYLADLVLEIDQDPPEEKLRFRKKIHKFRNGLKR